MLTPHQTVAAEARQVAVYSATANEVMYTVPNGRSFRGFVSGRNGSGFVRINGAELYLEVQSTGSNAVPFPLELVSGTVVQCGNTTGVSLVGVEF